MLKKHFIELAMAVLMLVCFYILSWEAAETAGRLIDVSGNIKADQVILVDAGAGIQVGTEQAWWIPEWWESVD